MLLLLLTTFLVVVVVVVTRNFFLSFVLLVRRRLQFVLLVLLLIFFVVVAFFARLSRLLRCRRRRRGRRQRRRVFVFLLCSGSGAFPFRGHRMKVFPLPCASLPFFKNGELGRWESPPPQQNKKKYARKKKNQKISKRTKRARARLYSRHIFANFQQRFPYQIRERIDCFLCFDDLSLRADLSLRVFLSHFERAIFGGLQKNTRRSGVDF